LNGNTNPRKKLIEDLNSEKDASKADLAAFVRKRQLQTYTSLQKIEDALRETGSMSAYPSPPAFNNVGLMPFNPGDANDFRTFGGKLGLIARLVQKNLGTRLYYVQLAGFDTHANQADMHAKLLGDLSNSIGMFLNQLGGEHSERVVVMTYSEFGRRV